MKRALLTSERIALQCSKLSDDEESVVDSDAEFDATLRPTTGVIGDVTAADAACADDDTTVISAEQVISEIESMLEVCAACFMST